MLYALFLSFIAGIFLAINRVFISRIGVTTSAMNASFWNHCGGFLFLLLLVALSDGFSFFSHVQEPPLYSYFGGVIGVFIGVLFTVVIPKLGVMKSTALIISGQIIMGSIIDAVFGKIHSMMYQMIGIVLIIIGLFLTRFLKKNVDV